jgi:two-component sensor histidine kinase
MVADRDRLLVAQDRLLAEGATLAQELQHRVRNNLQLVYGMLSKQIIAAEPSETEGISAIARRVMTLAKVYDHLLGTGLTRTIDFGRYLMSLCESFRDMENPQHHSIALVCHSDLLMLDLDTATALGLVVAELISNSYRHAFPGGTGTINVTLHGAIPGDEATISFVDNGVGFSIQSDSKRRGLGLITRLMQQVDGSVEVRSDHGTSCTLRFPVPTGPTEANSVASARKSMKIHSPPKSRAAV